MHLDSASASKHLDPKHPYPSPQHKPTKLRRFLSIGSRSSKARSLESSTPALQIFSTRPADSVPCTTKHAKRSISTLLLSRPCTALETEPAMGESGLSVVGSRFGYETGTLGLLMPAKEGGELDGSVGQYRKDSLVKSFYDVPLSASRTAALTSHPVGEKDLERVEGVKK